MDQENHHPSFPAPRFGLRKEHGQQKIALGNVNSNYANMKNRGQQQPKKVSSDILTIYIL